MSNKSLRDYINIVEARQDPNDQFVNDPYLGLGGAVEKGKAWAGSAIDRAKHFMEPAVSSDPTLQAHKARVAAAQPRPTTPPAASQPTDVQSAKPRSATKKPSSTVPTKVRPAPARSSSSAPAKQQSTAPKTSTTSTPQSPKTQGVTASQTAEPKAGQAAKSKEAAPTTKKASDPGVMQTQQFLKNLGYDIKLDGIWGPKTEEAYRAAFPNAPSNRREPTGVIKPNAGLTPDKYTQGKLDKAGQSADIAAAAGMPNPYLKPQQTRSTAPTQQPATTGGNFDANGNIIGMPGKVTSTAAPMGRDASGKPYTDWTGNNPQPGAKSLGEVSRIKDLVNYKK